MVAGSVILTIIIWSMIGVLMVVGAFTLLIGIIMIGQKREFSEAYPYVAVGLICWIIAAIADIYII